MSDDLDAVDLQRLGLILLTLVEMSGDHDVRIRQSKKDIWRVDVMYRDFRKTSHSGQSLLVAMEQSLDWLRRINEPLGRAHAMRQMLQAGRRTAVGLAFGWFILFGLADGGAGLPTATEYGPFNSLDACSQNMQSLWTALVITPGVRFGAIAACYWDGNGTP